MGLNRMTQAVREPGKPAEASSMAPADDELVRETIYNNEIPAFAAATLERLYSNFYCTVARIAAYESLAGISTYVRRRDARIETLILFRDQGHTVTVVNQQICLRQDEILSFCETIFSRYKKASVINFYALDLELDAFPLIFQQIGVLEENIIFFPPDKNKYLESLKGQFRKQLRNASQDIRRDYPSFHIQVVSRSDITLEAVQALLRLAEKRMLAKGKVSYTSVADADVLAKLLRTYGHMAIATTDDEMCGGAMWFGVGKRHFHQISACDPKYDQYMLGNQVWLEAILHSKELQGEECWLMGGSSVHKGRFRAQRRVFNSITVYRSRLHAAFNWRRYAHLWTRQQTAKIKAALERKSAMPGGTGRSIQKALAAARAVRSGLGLHRR